MNNSKRGSTSHRSSSPPRKATTAKGSPKSHGNSQQPSPQRGKPKAAAEGDGNLLDTSEQRSLRGGSQVSRNNNSEMDADGDSMLAAARANALEADPAKQMSITTSNVGGSSKPIPSGLSPKKKKPINGISGKNSNSGAQAAASNNSNNGSSVPASGRDTSQTKNSAAKVKKQQQQLASSQVNNSNNNASESSRKDDSRKMKLTSAASIRSNPKANKARSGSLNEGKVQKQSQHEPSSSRLSMEDIKKGAKK